MPRKLVFAAALLAFSRCLTANVILNMSADRVFLADGSVLTCTLISKGKESLVVLVGDGERTISASAVLRVERGEPAGERKSFATAPVGGHEEIIGPAEENVPPPAETEPVAAKAPRAAAERRPAQRGKRGVRASGDAVKGNKKESSKSADKSKDKAGQTPRRLPAGIDAEKIRKLINETEPEDLLKTIEDLKNRFSSDS